MNSFESARARISEGANWRGIEWESQLQDLAAGLGRAAEPIRKTVAEGVRTWIPLDGSYAAQNHEERLAAVERAARDSIADGESASAWLVDWKAELADLASDEAAHVAADAASAADEAATALALIAEAEAHVVVGREAEAIDAARAAVELLDSAAHTAAPYWGAATPYGEAAAALERWVEEREEARFLAELDAEIAAEEAAEIAAEALDGRR